MSDRSFKRSIGGSHGAAPINSRSINRNQAKGGPVAGYSKPKTSVAEFAKGRIAPEAGTGMNNGKCK